MKAVVIKLLALSVLVLLAPPRLATAQGAGSGAPPSVQIKRVDPSAVPTAANANANANAKAKVAPPKLVEYKPEKFPHEDRVESGSKLMALLFWAFAAATIGGALFVITRRNLIAAVMGMVGCFLGISAVYMMLYAHFLSVVQMLVYAGAIMVLFVFVVMILNRPEDEPVAPSGRAGQVIGGLAIAYLVGRLAMMLIRVTPPGGEAAYAVPKLTAEGHEYGTVKAVGTDLFGPGLFPFEAISILLLVAVVGAIAIARPLHEDEPPGADNV